MAPRYTLWNVYLLRRRRNGLEIRRDALDLPVAIAGGIEPAASALFFGSGSEALIEGAAAGSGLIQRAPGGG